MKTSKNDLTLENIEKLFDRKFDQKLVPVLGELDGLKQQITDVDNSLEAKIETLRGEVKEGFDTVFEGLTNLGETIDKDLEPRMKRMENKVFSQGFPLAK